MLKFAVPRIAIVADGCDASKWDFPSRREMDQGTPFRVSFLSLLKEARLLERDEFPGR